MAEAPAGTPGPASNNPGPAGAAPASSTQPQTGTSNLDRGWKALRKAKEAFRAEAEARGVELPKGKGKDRDREAAPVNQNVENLRNELRTMREAAAKEKREAAVSTAIASYGIDADNAEFLTDHINQRYAGAIKIDDNNGSVYYQKSDLDERKPVKELIGSIINSPKGERFKPAKQVNTNPDGLVSGNDKNADRPFFHQLTPDQRTKMTIEQQQAYVKEDMKLSGLL